MKYELVCVVDKSDDKPRYTAQVHFIKKVLFWEKRTKVGLYWSPACFYGGLMTLLAWRGAPGETSYNRKEIQLLFSVFNRELESGQSILNGFKRAVEKYT